MMIKRSLLSCLFVFTSSNLSYSQVQIHVSPAGSEDASGSLHSPLPSVFAARDRIRKLRQNGELQDTAIEVLIHNGRYQLSETFSLTAEDSGSPEFPITYKSIDGDVVLSGGIRLDEWQKVTDPSLLSRLPQSAQENVVCVELHSIGVDPGTIQATRLHQEMPNASMELFASGNRLPRAGWPNQGWALTVVEPSDHVASKCRWKIDHLIHPDEKSNAWAHGFWKNDWSDSFEPVMVDANSSLVQLSSSESAAPSLVRDKARYRLSNLLSELDMPGEWFVDQTSGLLLYWPIDEANTTEVTASILDTVVSAYDVESVTLSGLRIESARSMALEIVGGADVRVQDCEIAQASNVAVHVFGGVGHSIMNCDVSCTGSSAIRIEGGDRATLTPGEHLIEDCHVHDFSLQYLAGRPGIAVYGVGATVRNNQIHSGPDSAISLFGNEHLVEQNEIHHVCREADDSAAVHLSHDPTYRGNVIRKNYIHDLGGFSETGVFGIYLDDFASGTTVNDNYLVNTIRGVAVGGGRDNIIENNVIVGCLASIQLDARGTTWAKHHIEGEQSRIYELCRRTLATSPIYAERYPELAKMLDDEPAIPKGNIIKTNSFDSRIGIDLHDVKEGLVTMTGNTRKPLSDLARFAQERFNQLVQVQDEPNISVMTSSK